MTTPGWGGGSYGIARLIAVGLREWQQDWGEDETELRIETVRTSLRHTAAAISAGISEALITTAFGLFVAIPAVWAYNALGGRVERLSAELDRACDQLLMVLSRRA